MKLSHWFLGVAIVACMILNLGCAGANFGPSETPLSTTAETEEPTAPGTSPSSPNSQSRPPATSCDPWSPLTNVAYRCETARGSVYFRYSCTHSDVARFEPVGNATWDNSTSDCTNPAITTHNGGRGKCLFYATNHGRWGISFPVAAGVPSTLRQQIAHQYDCEHYALQPGVTVAECSADYTCVRVR